MSEKRSYEYRVVDVFTDQPLLGNALAVFPDASGMDTETMQALAKELNLAESTFVFPTERADCVARVRIFTPNREMPFAGHPTVGTSFVLMNEGLIPAGTREFALEENIGPVLVRVDEGTPPLIWLRTPKIEFGRTFEREGCARMLGLDLAELVDVSPQLVSAGNPTLFIPLRSKEIVDRVALDASQFRALIGADSEPLCVFVFSPTEEGVYSRMFAPHYGIVEDPATGSSTGPLATYMIRSGLISGAAGSRFISEQGTKMGRRSILHVLVHGEDFIEVGGCVVPVAEATIRI